MDKYFGQRRQSDDSYKRVDYNYISSQQASLSTGCDAFFTNYINALLQDGGLSLNQMERQSVALPSLIDEVIKGDSCFAESNLKIRNLTNDEILVDKKQIRFVITKVLENALLYSEGEHPAIIQIENANQAILLSIKDEGIGIDPFEKGKVFQPFYRGINSAKFSSGIGLGLTLSREIINHHDAEIRIESAGIGFGTAVYISFPHEDIHLSYAKQAKKSDSEFKTLAY